MHPLDTFRHDREIPKPPEPGDTLVIPLADTREIAEVIGPDPDRPRLRYLVRDSVGEAWSCIARSAPPAYLPPTTKRQYLALGAPLHRAD